MIKIEHDKRDADCLEVKVGKASHMIPLGKDMPLPYALKLRAANKLPADERPQESFFVMAEYISEYMGDDADKLKMGDVVDILNAWNDASEGDGAGEGE